MGEMAKKVQKCVRGWSKNAVGMLRTGRVFQKVTAGVSPVKQSVRQNEMGTLLARITILLTPTKCSQISVVRYTIFLFATITKNRPHVCGRCASRNNWTLHFVQGDEKLFKSGTRTPSRQDDTLITSSLRCSFSER